MTPLHRSLPCPIALCLLAVLAATAVYADTIELIHGTRLEGVIVSEEGDRVVIEVPEGRVTLRTSMIKEIVREGDANRHLRTGDHYLRRGDYAHAREAYQQAMDLPEGLEAGQRRMNELESVLEAKRFGEEARVKEQAEQLRAAGNYRNAIALLNDYVDEHGGSEDLLSFRGSIRTELAFWYYDHVQNDLAFEQIELARADGAPESRIHLLWSKIDMLEGRWSIAREEFQMALASDPNIAEEIAIAVPRSLSLQDLVSTMESDAMPTPISRSLPPRPLDVSRTEVERAIADAVRSASLKTGVDSMLVEAVIAAESSFDPLARSPVGAQGLMQLMPATAAMLSVTDAYDIAQNVDGGVRYLAQLQREFGDDQLDLVLAAYNAGPTRVKRYNNQVPPYAETREYIRRVTQYYNDLKEAKITSRLAIAG